jgi:CheY-like chemotaxis protein
MPSALLSVSQPTIESKHRTLCWRLTSRSPGQAVGASVEEPVLLLVEDDAVVLMCAEEALRDGGYAVVVATSGREALDALEAPSPQFAGLITDIRLGTGPDGWEVGRYARKHEAELPIVYVTGNAAGEWSANGVPNSLLVQKPYAPAQLVAAISTLITAADTSRAT